MSASRSVFKPVVACALLLAAAAVGFWIPLSRWSYTTGFDWDLFAGYSLVVRTCILVYHQIPLHDPWVWGGMDLLANPQTRIFSPMVLADVLFSPYGANLVSLVIYSFSGLLGMYVLLRGRGISPWTSIAGSLLFIQSSWFALHFVEGHIAYGSIQLLPWVLHFALNLKAPRSLFGLATLMALFALDGGIYALVYSLIILAAGTVVGLIKPAQAFSGRREQRALNVLSLLAAALLVSIKVVPVLLLTGRIQPQLDFTSLSVADLLSIFFNPFQRHTDVLNAETLYRFHEFGCYLSPVAIALTVWQWRSLRKTEANKKYAVLAVFFFWLASGFGGAFNPWHLLHRIPLFNMAHVQSRLFVVMDLFLVMLAATALDRVRSRHWLWFTLTCFLVTEATFVKSYPFYWGYQFAKPITAPNLIPKTSIRGVRGWGIKPELYFSGDYSYAKSYERAALPTQVLGETDPGYRGLLYPLSDDGTVALESYTPGRIEFSYSAQGRLKAEVDANFLGGWVIGSGKAEVHKTQSGLIGIDLTPGSGKIVLLYRPSYLPYVLCAYVLGLLLWLGLLIHFFRLRLRSGGRIR